MGERIINPLFNVQDKYKEMNIINPYKFSSGGTTLKDGLFSVWELDETSGTTAFDSHGSNDLANTGAEVNQTGKIDKAYDFVYTNTDYIYGTGPQYSFTDGISDKPFTLASWVNPTQPPSSSYIWFLFNKRNGSNEDEYAIFISEVGRTVLTLYSEGSASNSIQCKSTIGIISFTGWQHIVFTYDGSGSETGLNCYIDGNLDNNDRVENGTYTHMNVYTSRSMFIGQSSYLPTTTTRSYDGLIDQCAIWNRALTSTEVSDLYNSGNGLAYSSW